MIQVVPINYLLNHYLSSTMEVFFLIVIELLEKLFEENRLLKLETLKLVLTLDQLKILQKDYGLHLP